MFHDCFKLILRMFDVSFKVVAFMGVLRVFQKFNSFLKEVFQL